MDRGAWRELRAVQDKRMNRAGVPGHACAAPRRPGTARAARRAPRAREPHHGRARQLAHMQRLARAGHARAASPLDVCVAPTRAERGTARALTESMSNNTCVFVKSLAIASVLASGLASGSASGANAPSTNPGAQARANNSSVVTVPPNYVYNPHRGWPHDYCTASPDEFPAPVGPKADFRGPCARHDMCLEAHKVPAQVCHGQLRNDLITNCNHWYGWNNPLRYSCADVASKYWAVVTAWSRVPHP